MSTEKLARISVDLPSSGYPKRIPYNRYLVNWGENDVTVWCGLTTPDEGLIGKYGFHLFRQDLTTFAATFAPYLGSEDLAELDAPPELRLSPPYGMPESVKIMNAAHIGETGEIRLADFGICASVALGREESGNGSIQGDAVALLQAQKSIHLSLLYELFKDLLREE